VAASIFLNLLRLRCLERFGSGAVPVFWVLDEAKRYAHRIQLDQMLDLLRGANSPVCVGLQDVSQLGSEADQVRMLANCDTFITLTGASQATARFFSARLGRVAKPVSTMALDNTGQWRPTITHQDQSILGDREIMYPPVGKYGGVAQLRSGSAAPFLFSFS
jgi:type IV secretory pathway TraG/TraD family ATPase VirD4